MARLLLTAYAPFYRTRSREGQRLPTASGGLCHLEHARGLVGWEWTLITYRVSR